MLNEFNIAKDYKLIFVPSPLDISDYQGEDSYGCGVADFKKEVRQLINELAKAFYSAPNKEKTDIPMLSIKTKASAGYTPEFLVEASLIITSGALSAVFYKVISDWVACRNGRKLRVRLPSGFEVEATQLNKEEFQKLFEKLYSKYMETSSSELTPSHLNKLGFSIVHQDEAEEHESELRKLYFEKRSEISKMHRK